jgi:hypothetical protein
LDGWHVLVVWECETRDAEGLRARLESFLGPRSTTGGGAPREFLHRSSKSEGQGDDGKPLTVSTYGFNVPCRRFLITANITRDKRFPVVDEFVLRVLKLCERVPVKRLGGDRRWLHGAVDGPALPRRMPMASSRSAWRTTPSRSC